MKKFLKKSILVLPLLAFLTAYTHIPQKITVSQGEALDLRWGMTSEASTDSTGEFSCTVKLFNFIPIKNVDVSVTPKFYIIPSGEAIGVKLHTDGVMVIGMGEVADRTGKLREPAKDAGILTGDRIVEMNGEYIENTQDFTKKLNAANGNAMLSVMRNNEMITLKISAVYSNEGAYKAGIWVRDSTAGIGTLTFYNPDNSTFAALGHAICDSDTKKIMPVGEGTVNSCAITGVHKGKSGKPGELVGNFNNKCLGRITSNGSLGIYGDAESIPQNEPIAVATRFQIKEGKAAVMCDIDGDGVKTYEVEITKISKSAQINNKGFVLKVTDAELLEKTGGIVQGMSGAPILQEDMLVGAVTHVFVSDPQRGYGIFAENMLDVTMQMK